MDSCRLPLIELCEAIIDVLAYNNAYSEQREWESTLCACALTCRAWRARAQHVLWNSPRLVGEQRLALFISGLRTAPSSFISTLILAGRSHNKKLDLARAGELFVRPFPHLRRLIYDDVRFDRGPSARLLRMRLPFFDSLTALELWDCTFNSLRAMMDVIWACPNLASLKVLGCTIATKRVPMASGVLLSTSCQQLRACRALANLEMDWTVGPSCFL